MKTDIQRLIIEDVIEERERQDQKWGKTKHAALVWNAILNEEVGEVAHEILNTSTPNMKTELVQVAAVVFAWLEQIIERERIVS